MVEKRQEDVKTEEIVTLSDGTKVRCVAVSPLLIQAVMDKYKEPEPPVKTVKTKPGLEETYIDYNDAGYLREREKVERQRNAASTDAILLMGLPDVKPPKDDSWVKNLEALGLEIPKDGPRRRLAYIKYVLLRHSTDLGKVVGVLSRLSGATEEQIQEAVEGFRRQG